MKKMGFFVLAVVVLGCGGGGGGSTATIPTLSGTINATTYVLPAGSSARVNGDLVINASQDIKISGILIIDPEVNVQLIAANEVLVDGRIQAGTTAAPSRGSGPFNTIMGGQNVRVTGQTELASGSNLVIASTTATGQVNVVGGVSLPRGRDARSSAEFGQSGGAILIGSAAALQVFTGAGRMGFPPKTINIGGQLKAGDGGHGWDDVNGLSSGRSRSTQPTRGGHGGDVQIAGSGAVTIGAINLIPGSGGHGGWIGRARNGGSGAITASDGVANGEIGGDVALNLASGGSAGSISVSGTPLANGSTSVTVTGGHSSSAFCVAGKGGPAGPGGSVSCSQPLSPSKNSLGQDTPPSARIEVSGGHGGKGTPDSAGGSGGDFDPGSDFNKHVGALVIDDAFRGGNGFDGCELVPTIAGTDGGPGGNHESPVAPTLKGRAFNGGDGGTFGGGIVTQGGSAGTGGRLGSPGRPCGESHLILTLIRDLPLRDGLVLSAGTRISFSRIRGGTIAEPEGGCPDRHLHGPITVDGYGPFQDGHPTECGHGPVGQ